MISSSKLMWKNGRHPTEIVGKSTKHLLFKEVEEHLACIGIEMRRLDLAPG